MAWSCPECSRSHELPHKKCTCGYAYYEILGVKNDTPPDSVEQTYHYLLKVWKKSADAQDPHAGSKAAARLKKINDAHTVFLQIRESTRRGARDSTTVKFAVIGGIGLVMFVTVAFFLFSPSGKGSVSSVPDTVPTQITSPDKTVPSLPAPSSQEQADTRQTQAAAVDDRPDMHAEKTSDWAIESVRKSHALGRIATVDLLVNKWMNESSGKLRPLGWTARKADENIFLVSFMATDGITPKGLYFDINAETGEIRNVAGHPDLQLKYGITIK
jgi:hypothetical protein